MSGKKDLKRFVEVCLGTCLGCSHMDFWTRICEVKNKEVQGTDPACTDYKQYDMIKPNH